MSFYQRYKNYILGVALIVLLFGAYAVLFGGEKGGVLTVLEPEGPGTAVERELLSTLLELRSLQLNEAIFSDPAFRSLRDFGQPLTPQPIGRNNPFAPLGVGALSPLSPDADL